MRRQTRRAITNLSLFFTTLALIIYLTRPSPITSRPFPWSKIHYKTTSTTLPKAHGTCPGLSDTTKPALVVASLTTASPTWLNDLSTKYHLCIYAADAPHTSSPPILQTPANRGHESMAYLTFLIDNYATLPPSMVFIHGARFAWHNDSPSYDNLALLTALNLPSALTARGYHNLRCDWSASMCDDKYAPPQASRENSLTALLEPWNDRAVSDRALPQALLALFGDDGRALGRTDAIRAQCCAQFAVGRENIWRHGREEYIALRQWLLDGSATSPGGNARNRNAAPPNDRVAGRVLSYVWHILFLQQDDEASSSGEPSPGVDLERLNHQACPSAEECYCRLYGRCDLQSCETPGRCRGEYSIPPGFRLPENWAATHA